MRRAFKYRLYPNVNQARELGIMVETLRRLYNECLAQRIEAYKADGNSLSRYDQSKWFTAAKQNNTWYQRVNRSAVTATLEKLQRAYEAFFRRVKAGEKAGFPRFKGRDRFNSIEFQFGWKLVGNRLRIQYAGDIKVKLHRPVEGTIKTVTIKREADKWYVVFSCDLGDVPVEPSTNPSVGIDLGLSSFLTTSDGEHEPNPRYLKDTLPEVRRLSKKIALRDGKKNKTRQYTKRDSKRRAKAKAKLRKLHARVANQRKEHHHQTALKLVRRYGLIAVESLDIKAMLSEMGVEGKAKSQRFSRSISDAAWGGFVSILSSKAESAGVTVVKVDPRGTTQQCSGCGRVVPKTIRDRWHECLHCGLSLDRDENAARNILARGLPGWIGQAGANPGVALDCPRSVSPKSSVLVGAEPIKHQPVSGRTKPKARRKPKTSKDVPADSVDSRCVNADKVRRARVMREGAKADAACVDQAKATSLKRLTQGVFWD